MLTFLIPLALVAALALLLILLKSSQDVKVTLIEPWDIDPMKLPAYYFLPDRRAEFGRGLWLDADPPTWAWPHRPVRLVPVTQVIRASDYKDGKLPFTLFDPQPIFGGKP